MTITLDIQRTNDGNYSIWLSDNQGGSGIEVNGDSTNVIENLCPYIQDYIDDMENYIDRKGNVLGIGDKVIWYDPEEEERDLDRVWNVYGLDGDIVYISDSYGEAEVYAQELEKVE